MHDCCNRSVAQHLDAVQESLVRIRLSTFASCHHMTAVDFIVSPNILSPRQKVEKNAVARHTKNHKCEYADLADPGLHAYIQYHALMSNHKPFHSRVVFKEVQGIGMY